MSLAYSVDSGNESYFQTSLQTASSYPQLDGSLSWWGDPGNTITAAPTDALKRPSDFVAVLAAAQKLRIDFLPLAWQPGVAHIGLGGTAKVHQANMNAETYFAFKTFKQAQWMENIGETERPQRCRRAFHTLINEISILGHPSVRGHPAIMKLEGLTWEIMPSGQVWPVLVLDRAQYGDIKCFALSDTGRSMTLSARLELCASIGIGIQHLHNLNIIHGDVKPQNILIFSSTSTKFVTKITDFGYSTMYEGRGGILMPKSCPWVPPEWVEGHHFTFDEARNMDTYSFGMLCLWFLFHDADGFPTYGGASENTEQEFSGLEEIRATGGNMTALALRMIKAATSLAPRVNQTLSAFFNFVLAKDPSIRLPGLKQLPLVLSSKELVDDIRQQSGFTLSIEEASTDVISGDGRLKDEFSITSSIPQLWRTDFRVRNFIFHSLDAIYRDSTDSRSRSAAFQLAICCRIGIGPRDEANRYLHESLREMKDLEAELIEIRSTPLRYQDGQYESLRVQGLELEIGVEYYKNHSQLQQAYSACQLEYSALIAEFGQDSRVAIGFSEQFSDICGASGHAKEGADLVARMVAVCEEQFGPTDDHTLRAICSQATLLYGLEGRFDEAKGLFQRFLEIKRGTNCDSDDPDLIRTRGNLAYMLEKEGKYQEAATEFNCVLEVYRKQLGLIHPLTLQTLDNLLRVYLCQGKVAKILPFLDNLLLWFENGYGKHHRATFNVIKTVATVYKDQGMYREAIGLYQDTLRNAERYCGGTSIESLELLTLLAHTYNESGQWAQAQQTTRRVRDELREYKDRVHLFTSGDIMLVVPRYSEPEPPYETEALFISILDGCKTQFGPRHRYTRAVFSNLGSAYLYQRRFVEAETVLKEALLIPQVRQCEVVQFEDEVNLLKTKGLLATAYQEQGRYQSAVTLREKVLEGIGKLLGQDHPDNLISLRRLGNIYRIMKRDQDARPVFERGIEVAGSYWGPKNHHTLEMLLELARLEWDQGNIQKSNNLYQAALLACNDVGDNDLTILTVVHDLAELDRQAKRFDQAEILYNRALAGFQKHAGPEDPRTLTIQLSVATMHYKRGRHSELENLMKWLLQTRERVSGYQHPATLKVASLFEAYLEERGRKAEAKARRKQFNLRAQKNSNCPPTPQPGVRRGLADLISWRGGGRRTKT